MLTIGAWRPSRRRTAQKGKRPCSGPSFFWFGGPTRIATATSPWEETVGPIRPFRPYYQPYLHRLTGSTRKRDTGLSAKACNRPRRMKQFSAAIQVHANAKSAYKRASTCAESLRSMAGTCVFRRPGETFDAVNCRQGLSQPFGEKSGDNDDFHDPQRRVLERESMLPALGLRYRIRLANPIESPDHALQIMASKSDRPHCWTANHPFP